MSFSRQVGVYEVQPNISLPQQIKFYDEVLPRISPPRAILFKISNTDDEPIIRINRR